jgi:hypothetical protein
MLAAPPRGERAWRSSSRMEPLEQITCMRSIDAPVIQIAFSTAHQCSELDQ